MKYVKLTLFAFLIFAVITPGLTSWSSSAQQQDQTRGLHVKKMEESRPASSSPSDPKQPRTYRSANSKASSSELKKTGSGSEALIGLTIWRLRAVGTTDNGSARILEQKSSSRVEWQAERIEADSQINDGDRVRISVESPSTGYLYVIDREQYADGGLGDPFLIFPTTHTRGGNNSVSAGRVIEFPAQEDEPPYFVLTKSRPEHVGELLMIIVAPQRIEGVQIAPEPLKLPVDKVAGWEKEWGGTTERFELEGGGGLPYSAAEKEAGQSASRMLTQVDPLPQTILRLNAKAGSPVLVKVVLRIAR